MIDGDVAGTSILRSSLRLPGILAVTRVAPLLFVLGLVVALVNAGPADPYWLDLTSKSTTGLLLLGPGFAAACAWDASRWRMLSTTSVRGRTQQLLATLTPVVLATAGCYCAALAVLGAREHPEAGLPYLPLLATSLLVAAGYASTGFALGTLLPRFYAVVSSFAAVWLWLALTPTMEPFWMRNVTGNFGTSCCEIDKSLAAHSLLAPSLTAVGLGTLTILVLRDTPRRLLSATAGLSALILCIGSGGWLARDLGPDPVIARTGAQVCVRPDGGPAVCAWPEHKGLLATAAPDLARAVKRLEEAGFETPAKLRENQPSGPGRLSFSLRGSRAIDWVSSLAISPLAGYPPPCTDDTGGHWPAGGAYEPVGVWLLVTAGVRPADARAMLGVGRSSVLARLMEKSPTAQAAWIEAALSAMATCSESVPE